MDPSDQAPGQDRQPGRSARPLQGGAEGPASRQGPAVTQARDFRFVQWEFAGPVAPPGRYVVRRYAGDEARAVVVVSEAAAPRRLGRREPHGTVPVTRVTVIDAGGSSGAWLPRA